MISIASARSVLRCAARGTMAIGATIAASPALAQAIPVRTPLSTDIAGNVDKLVLLPTIRALYDSNVFRTNDQRLAGPKDNARVTPGVALSMSQPLGRFAIRASANVGYDFNSRFRKLNRSRIDANGSIAAPVGAQCRVNAVAAYERFQFDFGDTDQLRGAASIYQAVGGKLDCTRAAGLAPTANISYVHRSNDRQPLFDYDTVAFGGGLTYTKPSLGVVTISADFAKIRRPAIQDLLGVNDDTDIQQLRISLSRDVAPRLKFRLGGGYLRADPVRSTVKPFSGLSFDGEMRWLFTPRATLLVSALRDVQNQSGFSATYILREVYRASFDLQPSARSTVGLSGALTRRDFRGENLALSGQPRVRDATRSVSADYGFALLPKLRLGLNVGHSWRTGANDFYDYTATTGSASISARF